MRKKGISIALSADPSIPMFELRCTTNRSMFAGLVITYCKLNNQFEVMEYQAGENKELWIYGYYKSPLAALKKLVKADMIKRPIKIYN